MNSTDALREILHSHTTKCYDEDYGTMVIKIDSFVDVLSDLTALISEGYVSKKAYNTVKEHYQGVLYANDIEKDYIDKYYYPKEFVQWITKPEKVAVLWSKAVVKGLDELYEYWKENER